MFSKIVFLGFLTILPFASISSAATVTYDLTATVIEGPGLGLSTLGFISFDDSFLVTGNEVLAPLNNGGVSLSFGVDLDGSTVWFTQENDTDYPAYPQITFKNFLMQSISYFVQDGVNGAQLAQYGVYEFAFENSLTWTARSGYNVGVIVRPLNPATVPLPAGLPLLALALSGLTIAAWRRPQPKEIATRE